MSPIIQGRRKIWLLPVVLVPAALLTLCLLPYFVETLVLPGVLNRAGLDDYQIAVFRLGFNGVTLQLHQRPGTSTVLTTGTIRVDWSLSGLRQRRLDRVIVNGLRLHLPTTHHGGKKSPAPSLPKTTKLPLTIDLLRITDSAVSFNNKNLRHLLPFSLSARHITDNSAARNNSNPTYQTELTIAGQKFNGDITYNAASGALTTNLRGNADLPVLAEYVVLLLQQHPQLRGTAELSLRAETCLFPLQNNTLKAELKLHDFQAKAGGIILQNAGKETTRISVTGANKAYHVTTSGLTLAGPVQASIDLETAISLNNGRPTWQGSIIADLPENQQVRNDFILNRVPVLRLQYSGSLKNNRFDLRLSRALPSAEPSRPVTVTWKNMTVTVGNFNLHSHINLHPQNKGRKLTDDVMVQCADLAINGKPGQLIIPRLEIKGRAELTEPGDINSARISGRLNIADASLVLPQQRIRLQGIQLDLPLTRPWQRTGPAGELQIKDLSLRRIQLGRFSGAIETGMRSIALNGQLIGSLLPDMTIDLLGEIRAADNGNIVTELSFSSQNDRIDLERLTPLFPELHSISGSGLLDITGHIIMGRCGLHGDMQLGLRKGSLFVSDPQLTLTGINGTLNFPDLPHLRTTPNQKLSIDAIRTQKSQLTDLKTSFRIESPQSLFIEKMSGQWSGGRLFTDAFRLQRGAQETHGTLFCDRLQLPELLTQLGLAEAEGTGSLSGLIPLTYSNRQIMVDHGFLFSTPGEQGRLKIKNSQQLTTRIPGDTPQFSPLHFVGAALKDFKYTWAKLFIFSKDENLVLQLKIDGKPSEPLPYRYDVNNNVFVPIDQGGKGGIEQPVKLDVNFKIPVNKLLRYQKRLMPLLHNIR